MDTNPFFSLTQHATTQENPFFASMQESQPAQDKNPFFDLSPVSQAPQDPWQAFQEKAATIAKERQYPASVLLGQAALESGHGTSNFARERNNFFGYQAYDSDPNQAKAYDSPEQSINDYLDLIQYDPRYSWAYQQYVQDQSPDNLIANIRGSGYATDPDYAQKVMSMPEYQQYATIK